MKDKVKEMKKNMKLILALIISLVLFFTVIILISKANKNIEITKEVRQELRSLIPTHCGGYDEELYQDKKIVPEDISKKTNEDCSSKDIHLTFTSEKSITVSRKKVYLYDYVLIYSLYGEGEDHIQWANQYNHFQKELKVRFMEGNQAKPTKESFLEYARVYKYTFKKEKDGFHLLSVEPVKS